jgi:hypothetical protein
MNFNAKIMPLSTAFTQIVDDEMIILDTQSQNYFALDAIGLLMWEKLSEVQTAQRLYLYMLEHYEVEASVLKKDIEVFIQTLLEHKLLIGEL